MTYEFGPCTCGHTLSVDAEGDDAAVSMAIDMAPAHFAEFHPGESVPPREQLEPMLRQLMRPAA